MDLYGVDFVGLRFSSPLVGSSGTVGYGFDLGKIADISCFGGLVFKTITPQLRLGNAFPRICETEVGMINAIGLQNEGWDKFMQHYLPKVKEMPHKKIVSLAADTVKDFAFLVKQASFLQEIDILELNICCPNVDYGGSCYMADHGLLRDLLQACVSAAGHRKPIMVKISPHISSLREVIILAEDCKIDAFSMINTLRGLKIDTKTKMPLVSNVVGGYSGVGIKPIALAMVYEASQITKLPILGIGGVMTGNDVVEYMLAGATLVGVGTANMINPAANKTIFKQFAKYLAKNKVVASDLIGAMLPFEEIY